MLHPALSTSPGHAHWLRDAKAAACLFSAVFSRKQPGSGGCVSVIGSNFFAWAGLGGAHQPVPLRCTVHPQRPLATPEVWCGLRLASNRLKICRPILSRALPSFLRSDSIFPTSTKASFGNSQLRLRKRQRELAKRKKKGKLKSKTEGANTWSQEADNSADLASARMCPQLVTPPLRLARCQSDSVFPSQHFCRTGCNGVGKPVWQHAGPCMLKLYKTASDGLGVHRVIGGELTDFTHLTNAVFLHRRDPGIHLLIAPHFGQRPQTPNEMGRVRTQSAHEVFQQQGPPLSGVDS